jgi:hypothetical protein
VSLSHARASNLEESREEERERGGTPYEMMMQAPPGASTLSLCGKYEGSETVPEVVRGASHHAYHCGY